MNTIQIIITIFFTAINLWAFLELADSDNTRKRTVGVLLLLPTFMLFSLLIILALKNDKPTPKLKVDVYQQVIIPAQKADTLYRKINQ